MGNIKNDIPDITVVITNGDEYRTSIQPSEIYQVIVNTGDNYNVNIDGPTVITEQGSGSYITAADYATYALTASFAQTASYISGSANNWIYITDKPVGLVSSSTQASQWTVLSASYASNVAAVTWNTIQGKPSGLVSSSQQINTGSFTGSFRGTYTGSVFGTSSFATRATTASYAVTASYAANVATVTWDVVQQKPSGLVSSSTQVALNQISGNTFASGTYTFPNNVTVGGTLSASKLYVAQIVTVSTQVISGSTIFGSSSTDTHLFNGSIIAPDGITGSLYGTASFATSVGIIYAGMYEAGNDTPIIKR